MPKIISISITMLLVVSLLTGCGCDRQKEEGKNNKTDSTQTVVDDQIYEGLEFVNIGASDGVIKTTVINNTGVVYEGSKFSIKIMDNEGNVIAELIDQVKGTMETGTTKIIETKVDKDLSKASAIEYSIVK